MRWVLEPFLVHGTLHAATEQPLKFPVDGLTGRIDVMVGAQRLTDVSLVDPQGFTVADDTPGVSLQIFEHMRLIALDTPAPGN